MWNVSQILRSVVTVMEVTDGTVSRRKIAAEANLLAL
jgi:hypothetical protein